MAKYQVGDYVVKVAFVGDSITPLYRFRVYRPRKYWFAEYLWEEKIHRSKISLMSKACEQTVESYHKAKRMWD